MVVTEEIMKCWMCSDRPITHCLITGTKVTTNTPYVSNALLELMSPTLIFGIKTKLSNSSIFVSMNVIRISRMNQVEIYLKECVLILSIV